MHTDEDINQVRESLPKLGPVGAFKIHKILISPDGLVRKKHAMRALLSKCKDKRIPETKKKRE